MEVRTLHPENLVSDWLIPIFVQGILPVSLEGDRVNFNKNFAPSAFFAFLQQNRTTNLVQQVTGKNGRNYHIFTEIGKKVRNVIRHLVENHPEMVQFFIQLKKAYRVKLIHLIRMIAQSSQQQPMTQNDIRVLYRRFKLTAQLFKDWNAKMLEKNILTTINGDPNRMVISELCQAFLTAFTQETQHLITDQTSPLQITQQEINFIIRQSVNRFQTHQMQNFAIVSIEGLPIHSTLKPDISEVHLSALTAVTYSICERLCINLNFGDIEYVLMSDDNSNHVIIQRHKDYISFLHYVDSNFSITNLKQIVPSIAHSWYYFITNDGITTDISNFFGLNDEPYRTHMIQLATQHNTSERILMELKSPTAQKCVTLIKGSKGAIIIGLANTLVTETYQRDCLSHIMGSELDMIAGIMTHEPNTIEDPNLQNIEAECKKLLEIMEKY